MFGLNKYRIRDLSEIDLLKISEWIIDDAKKEHIFPFYQDSINMLTMINAMRDNIYGMPFRSLINGKEEERIGRVLIYGDRKNVIGYALIYEKEPGSIDSDIELKLFHIDEKYQNKGHATKFLKLIEKRISKKTNLYVECLAKSKGMMHLLEKNNYEIISISQMGKKSYRKRFG